jgi:hypothetical protein
VTVKVAVPIPPVLIPPFAHKVNAFPELVPAQPGATLVEVTTGMTETEAVLVVGIGVVPLNETVLEGVPTA